MKTKPANKGSKEPVSRKPKKFERKCIYGKEKPDDKKQRRPIQKNRFTSIEELQSPTGNVPFELFGSLIFNLAQETSDVHISDNTGDYELRVSNDTLKEFKLKVLLGIDHRSKPKFTILLGDCQCYPELPEGTLNLESRIHAEDESVINPSNVKINDEEDKEHPIKTGLVDEVIEIYRCSDTIPEPDIADSMEARSDVTAVEQVNVQKSHIPPEQRDADDELTQLSRKSSTTMSAKKVEKHRSKEHKKNSQVKKQRPVKMHSGASTYMNNLEGFIQFLMNDEICYSALASTRTPPNVTKVARRIVGGRNLIKYSDGKEFLITFEEKDASDEGKQTPEDKNESSCPPNSVKSDSDDNLSTLKELLSASDDRKGKRLEEEAVAREELMRSNEFVETVKNEIIEWQARCEEAIDVTIVHEEAATLKEKPVENMDINVSDVINALHKVDDVYEDATSDSSNIAQADSLEQFFLELDEYDKVAASKEANVTGTLDKGLTLDNPNNVKTGATSVKSGVSHFQHRYVPPIPLNMTSAKDIELMWMAFVKQFCSSDGRLNTEPTNNSANQRMYKTDMHFGQYRQSYSDIGSTGNIMKNSNTNVDKLHSSQNPSNIGCTSKTMRNSSIDQNVYPGQNCLPYFVEANLKRVNSVLGSIQVSSSHTSHTNKSEHNFMLFGNSHAGVPEPKFNFSAGVRVLNPGKFNPIGDRRGGYPLQRNANTLPKERFQNQRNRIFFNPNVSAGDWY